MKMFLISDNADTKTGLRLAGIEGVIVHERDEVKAAIDKALEDPEIAVVMITEKLVNECKEYIYGLKLSLSSPLLITIPDRHGQSDKSEIENYVRDAIGLKI